MTLLEAKRRVRLAFTLGITGQLITFSLLLIGLLASLTELPVHDTGGLSFLVTTPMRIASHILTAVPGALHLVPISPRYYPGQLEGNLAFAVTALGLAVASSVRRWGSHLRAEVNKAEKKARSKRWEQTNPAAPASTIVHVGNNFGGIQVISPSSKAWWTRPFGILLLAVVAGVAVNLLTPFFN